MRADLIRGRIYAEWKGDPTVGLPIDWGVHTLMVDFVA
jgi:hypothetical protein